MESGRDCVGYELEVRASAVSLVDVTVVFGDEFVLVCGVLLMAWTGAEGSWT